MNIILLIIGFLFCLFIAFVFSLIKIGRRTDEAEEKLISMLLSSSLDNTKITSNDKKLLKMIEKWN